MSNKSDNKLDLKNRKKKKRKKKRQRIECYYFPRNFQIMKGKIQLAVGLNWNTIGLQLMETPSSCRVPASQANYLAKRANDQYDEPTSILKMVDNLRKLPRKFHTLVPQKPKNDNCN
uniref:Uncharacterized protein n=1 Tax=Rhizophora mucronata TaxID=61149 RepID=A0A2P2IM90_RHIMU